MLDWYNELGKQKSKSVQSQSVGLGLENAPPSSPSTLHSIPTCRDKRTDWKENLVSESLAPVDFGFFVTTISWRNDSTGLSPRFSLFSKNNLIFFLILFIYLFIYGCVGSSFLCEGFL